MKMKVGFKFACTTKRSLKPTNSQFAIESSSDEADELPCASDGSIDYSALSEAKRSKKGNEKHEEVRRKGERLASEGDMVGALQCFQQLLTIEVPTADIYEMIAQVHLELDEPIKAIESASNAVKLMPNWFPAFQTLGRAQLNIGEVEVALRCFSKAVHLAPYDKELLHEDLLETWKLLRRVKESLDVPIEPKEVEESSADDQLTESVSSSSKYFGITSGVAPKGFTVLRIQIEKRDKTTDKT